MPKKDEEAATPKAPKERLLALTVTTPFVDGNLAGFFAQYGYSVEWSANEVRNIPAWLAKRCEQSGAQLERADDD